MKIGVSTGSGTSLFDRKELFPRLKKIGYDTLDYNMFGKYSVPEPVFSGDYLGHYRETARIIRDCGLEVEQTHATFATDYIERGKLLPEQVEQFAKEIEVTAILGAKYIVIHPINTALYDIGKDEEKQQNYDAYRALMPYLKQHGVVLAIENMFGHDNVRRRIAPTGCSTPEDMIAYTDMMQSDCFCNCLDVGHLNLLGLSPAEAVLRLGKRLKILHVHDNYGINDLHNPIGYGNIDFKAFMTALKTIGYDGAFCMEIIPPEKKFHPELLFDSYTNAYRVARTLIDGMKQ